MADVVIIALLGLIYLTVGFVAVVVFLNMYHKPTKQKELDKTEEEKEEEESKKQLQKEWNNLMQYGGE